MNKKKKISFKSYEKMAEYYFNYVDTKPFNAYYERPGTLNLLPDVKGKKFWMLDVQLDGIQNGFLIMAHLKLFPLISVPK